MSLLGILFLIMVVLGIDFIFGSPANDRPNAFVLIRNYISQVRN